MPSKRLSPPRALARLRAPAAVAAAFTILFFGLVARAGTGAGNLDQAVNGGIGKPPISPVEWVNGNANGQKAHYKESDSIPYRLKLTDLTAGTPNTLVIEWDIKHSDKHAIDYITHYQQGIAETVEPLNGITGVPAGFDTEPIPAPSSAGSPTGGQPTTSFNNLPAAKREMTLFGGTITSMAYEAQGNLTASQSATQMRINFTPTGSTAVFAWGGHIADEDEWGKGKSATGISGSPYHTRLQSLNGGSVGNQDRSLSTSALSAIPVTLSCAASPATLCAGESSTLTATAGGGVPPYSYVWSPAAGLSGTTGASVTATPAGTTTYTVTVTDSDNPAQTLSSTCTVTVNPKPIVSVSPATAEICQGSSQALTATPSGGTAPYTYKWTTQGGTIPAGTDTESGITVSVAGTYTVTVTDTNGCKGTASRVVVVNPNPTVSLAPTNPNVCAGGSTALTATPAGGTSPYTYNWTGPNGAIVNNAPTLVVNAAGAYTVSVTDDKGCSSAPASVTVVENPNPTVSVDKASQDVCDGGTVKITATGSGGTPGYTYSWTGPGGFTANTPDITVGTAGTYQVVATDSKGCKSAPASSTLTVNPKPSVLIDDPTPDVCAGGSTKIKATGSGTTAPYTYSWTGPGNFTASTDEITISVAGTYVVTVRDSAGCSATASATLTINPNPTVGIDNTAPQVCAGGSTKIKATGSGGTGPYTYSWTGPGTFTASTDEITISVAGSYVVIASDSKGCKSAPASATLTVNPNPTVSINNPAPQVCDGGSAKIKATGSGGTGPYTYSWTGPGNFAASTDEITITAAGSYVAIATDSKGCKSAPASATLTVNPKPSVSIDKPSPEACAGGTTKIKASGTGGAGGYTYSWTGPGSFTGNTAEITISVAGTYEVTVTDSKGCKSAPATATLTVNPKPQLSITPPVAQICAGGSQIFAPQQITGGTGPFTYAWTGPSGYSNNTETITVSAAGTYTLKVTDSKGCASDMATATLTVNALPDCSITGRSSVVAGSGPHTFTGPAGVSGWSWSVSANAEIQGPSDQQSVDIVSTAAADAGSITLTLTTNKTYGTLECTKTCTKVIRVLAPSEGLVTGEKYLDENYNGQRDNVEPGIPGWKIRITYIETLPNVQPGPYPDNAPNPTPVDLINEPPIERFTGPDGTFEVTLGHEGMYLVEEVFPGGAFPGTNPGWINSTVRRYIIVVPPGDSEVYASFGNIYLQGAAGGKTLGFWSNKNGEAILAAWDPQWRERLTWLNLVNADGSPYDPTPLPAPFAEAYGGSKKLPGGLRPWLLNGTAVNMAYMLSVQMATTELNVQRGAQLKAAGFVGEALTYDTEVVLPADIAACIYQYAPAGAAEELANGGKVISVGKLLTLANSSLAVAPITIQAGPQRLYQDCLKTACDLINNNKLPYVTEPVLPPDYP